MKNSKKISKSRSKYLFGMELVNPEICKIPFAYNSDGEMVNAKNGNDIPAELMVKSAINDDSYQSENSPYLWGKLNPETPTKVISLHKKNKKSE